MNGGGGILVQRRSRCRHDAARTLALALGLVLGALAFLPGRAALAQGDPAASAWFATDQGKVRLIAAAPAVGEGDAVRLGLEFRLAPDWKIYWRSPGDAGMPPQLDWTGSQNLAGATIDWPAPRRFSAYGLETIGYEDAVVLPITARLDRPGAPLHLVAALNYLTCKDICIPYSTVLRLDLPAGAATGGGYADLIARYARLVPGAGTGSGLRLEGARLVRGQAPLLDLAVAANRPFASPDAFIEGPAGIGFDAPKFEPRGDGRAGILAVPLSGDAAAIAALPGQRLRVTLVDGMRGLEASVTAAAGPPPPAPLRLATVLAIALLGGLILNVMPCVLPVLSLKLLTVTGHAGATRAAIRRGFLASAAGILAAFLGLALVTIALKAAGLAIGWGIQFQQPAFLAFMVVLLALFAANLAGLFEIPLPGWLGGLAGSGAAKPTLAGHFTTGVFATLLATPCSAPYLGTAVGFALAGGSLDTLAIFHALGCGLALPYLAVAAFPRLAALLPRPGRWMLALRRILAGLLGLTALWLLWVLAAQTSPAAALALLLALALAALAGRRIALPRRRNAAVAAALLLAFALPLALPAPPAASAAVRGMWRRFDDGAIGRLVGQGKTVFVDVTADWCINCKVNERLVLSADPVSRRLAAPDVVAMRADWTRPDAEITRALQEFGREGVPLYVLYSGRENEPPTILPQILTPAIVITELDKLQPTEFRRSST
jgi:suppressor for copper-sensitivity B